MPSYPRLDPTPPVEASSARFGLVFIGWPAGPTTKAARRADELTKSLANEAYSDLAPIMAAMRAEGLSLRVIADWLNAYRGPQAIATFPGILSDPKRAGHDSPEPGARGVGGVAREQSSRILRRRPAHFT